ncbi:MAG TPA: hypothetical protein VHB25_08550 [Gemmatimonadaceae bacterium]|nr:hypothetical protein [Gemmatimonadaceae bacterium]
MDPKHAPAGSGGASLAKPDEDNAPVNAALLDNSTLADRLEQIAKRAGAANTRDAIAEAATRLRALGAAGVVGNVADADAAGNVPLWLDSTVHVHRPDANEKPTLHVVKGGCLVSATDLTAAEIDELTALRVIRFATPAELRAAAARVASGAK